MKNRKFIDVFFYDGQIDLFNLRVNELNPYVYKFICIGHNTGDLYHEKLIKYDYQKENIFEKILLLLKSNEEFFFDDILMLSDVSELPNLNEFEDVIQELKYGPLFLNHTNLVWNKNYRTINFFVGTMIFEFSHLIQKSYDLQKYYDEKSIKKFTVERKSNGWKFNSSDNLNYIDVLPHDDMIDPIKTYQLIKDTEVILPKHIDLWKQKKVGRDYVKKHLFLIDPINLNELEQYEKEYDTISVIYFSFNLDERFCETFSNKTMIHHLYLPEIMLYGKNLVGFRNEYKKNEVKKISSTVFPQPQDIIHIIN